MIFQKENITAFVNFCIFCAMFPFYMWLLSYHLVSAVAKDTVAKIWLYLETGNINPETSFETEEIKIDSRGTHGPVAVN